MTARMWFLRYNRGTSYPTFELVWKCMRTLAHWTGIGHMDADTNVQKGLKTVIIDNLLSSCRLSCHAIYPP